MRHSAKFSAIITVFFLLVFMAASAFAVPQTINYQGRLETSGGDPVNGTVSINFSIYNAPSGGAALWTETQPSVVVTDGAFSVALGSVTPITGLLFDEPYYLGVAVNGDAEMSPRASLVSVPYSMRASDSDTLNGQHSSEIIDAARDEVRTPISSLPFTIDTPGSYYLTGDLSASWTAIMVVVDNVTIDLMGFSITGSGPGDGINMDGRENVEIKNGSIMNFTTGIYGSGKNHRIVNLRVLSNVGSGIRIYNDGHLVKNCYASGNGAEGIYIDNNSTVTGNTASYNQGHGIYVGQGNTVSNNTVYANNESNNPVNAGIYVGSDNQVRGNTVWNNLQNNIYVFGSGNVIEENLANGSIGYGIYVASADNVSSDNHASGNSAADFGGSISGTPIPILVLPYTIDFPGSYYLAGDLGVVSTTANGITVNASDVTIDLMGFSIKGPGSGSGNGIHVNGTNVEVKNGTVKGFGRGVDTGPSNVRIINIRAFQNVNEGIRTYVGLVKDCTAALNGFSGIYVQGSAIVSGNFAYQNQHYGINLSGDSLVDGNTAYGNDQSGGGFANMSACPACTFGKNHAP